MNINATLIVQIVVFVALWWFTARFVWPPITRSLDERSKRIADGLAAADKAKADLASAERRVADELKQARDGAAEVRSGAERQAGQLLEEARAEAGRIVAPRRPQKTKPPWPPSAPRTSFVIRSPSWRLPVPSASCAARSTRTVTPICWPT